VEYKEEKATHPWQWVVLAIDVPLLNVQTPKAVEQMFSHIAGALDDKPILHEKSPAVSCNILSPVDFE
jgi:hypothetical protein